MVIDRQMEVSMYVVTGATGNTGRVIANRLLDEGKKVRWVDGLDAVYVLLKCRLTRGK